MKTQAGKGTKKRRKLLPPALVRVFERRQLLCMEFTKLTPAQEREIFQVKTHYLEHMHICSLILHTACPKGNATHRRGLAFSKASLSCNSDNPSLQNASKQSIVPTDPGLANYKVLMSTTQSTSTTSSLSLTARADTNSLWRPLLLSSKASYHRSPPIRVHHWKSGFTTIRMPLTSG